MKRKIGVLFLVLAASLMVCSVAMAKNRAEAWSVTPFIGGQHFNSDTHLDKAPIGGVRVGYNLTEAWTLEGLVSLGLDNDSDNNGYGDAKITNYRLEA
ncbi:MAG: porin family protein, partial [Syntrophobacterales bacterium]|nr:porin family protein [Syntrophobacterales bacterium]